MVVATPNLTFTVTTPAGVVTDYSSKLAWGGAGGSVSITQNFGRQGDTATFTIVDDYGSTGTSPIFIPVFSRVTFFDNIANIMLFAGVINDPVIDVISPTRNEWHLKCTDYTFYADNQIVQGVFIGQTVDDIIISLTQQANCGITAKKIQDGGFVAPGPQLASFVSNYTTLSGAWRKLAQLAGQVTPYGWYVDENRNLHFYDATTAINSGVTFTTSPTTAGSTTEGHINVGASHGYEWDGQSVRNRILVQGATQTIKFGTINDPATDTWLSNGVQFSWPMRFTVTGSPLLKINGVLTPVTPLNAGETSTATWQIAQNSVGGWFLTTTSIPAAGRKIQVWYDYLVPIIAQANDFGSQALYTGPNNGVFTEYISDSSLTTVPMALARAMRQRSEYAFAAERYTFSTSPEFMGWVRSGQTCTVINQFIPDTANNNQPGINASFIIVGNSVQFGPGGYRSATLTAIRI